MTGSHAEDWKAQGVPNIVLIEKPFAPTQLLTAIAELLNKGATLACVSRLRRVDSSEQSQNGDRN